MDKPEVIAVVGPTASGKSGLAVRIALAVGGEVISGDSMQIYKGMDIGTAKISEEEKQGVPHHLLDLRSPQESFSVAEYQTLARAAIAAILDRGKIPIIVGGTGLYIDSALYNYEYRSEEKTTSAVEEIATEGASSDETSGRQSAGRQSGSLREVLQAEAMERGPEAVWEKLMAVDPVSATRLHVNDTKRVIRALEYAQTHGRPISQNKAAYEAPALLYASTAWLGLNLAREKLYERINERVEQMMAEGLLAEVERLREQGLRPDSQAGQAIGYKQLLQYLDGAYSLPEAVEAIKQESRRYAKRQLTWFRRNKSILWLDAEELLGASFVGIGFADI